MHLTIVTSNAGKFHQIADRLPKFVQAEQHALDLVEIQTSSLAEISSEKCREAFGLIKKPVLVDDTGIYFHAFNQFPGALTKFLYQGVGLEGIQNLYTGVENKAAYFQCVLSYMDETTDEPVQFVGEVQGELNFEYLRTHEINPKLPYDTIFVPEGFSAPAITDMPRWKSISHRNRATEKLAEWLVEQRKI